MRLDPPTFQMIIISTSHYKDVIIIYFDETIDPVTFQMIFCLSIENTLSNSCLFSSGIIDDWENSLEQIYQHMNVGLDGWVSPASLTTGQIHWKNKIYAFT